MLTVNKFKLVRRCFGYYFAHYSDLSNRHIAWNKCGGGKDEPFLISVVPGISVMVGKMSHS